MNKAQKERLQRLLQENKTRLARDQAIEAFQKLLNYTITKDNFIDFNISNVLMSRAYKKILHELQNQKSFDYQDILTMVHLLKRATTIEPYRSTIFYHFDSKRAGGIKITLQDCWDLIDRIGPGPKGDILFVDEAAAFGLCIEPDEHNYVLTHWGLD